MASVNGSWRWAVPAAALILAGGVLLGAFTVPPLLPSSAEPVRVPRVVPVADRLFDDAHTVPAVPQVSDTVMVGLTGGGGLVTASRCAPGGEVHSGDHLLSIDGVVRLAIVTAVPLWRDLGYGDTGPDVTALQRALGGQAGELPVSGRYDSDTVAVDDA